MCEAGYRRLSMFPLETGRRENLEGPRKTNREPGRRRHLSETAREARCLSDPRELLGDSIPSPAPLFVKVYRNVDVEKVYGARFTIWNVLLNDSDAEFKKLLCQLNDLATKHRSAYGAEKLRAGLGDPFSFRSELTLYDTFKDNGFPVIIEPPTAQGSKRKADLAVSLHQREVFFEVITPRPSEDFLGRGGGFAAMDLDLSKKVAGEIVQHFDLTASPTEPTVIGLDGTYNGLDSVNVESAVDRLNRLKVDEFPGEKPDRAPLLSSKARLFVSAVLLFRSNSDSHLAVNPTGPNLNRLEIQALNKVFGLSE